MAELTTIIHNDSRADHFARGRGLVGRVNIDRGFSEMLTRPTEIWLHQATAGIQVQRN